MNDNLQIIKDDEIDLRVLFTVLYNARFSIFKITTIFVLVAIIYSLLATPLYKSTITMYPNNENNSGELSQLQGMASAFGFNIGGSESSFHIPDIINSRLLKSKLIYNKWENNKFDSSIDLIHYWGINGDNRLTLNPITIIKRIFTHENKKQSLSWEEAALEKISDRISVKEDKNGLIVVNVLMEEAALAAQLSNYIYDLVINISKENYAQSAKLNTEFIGERQGEVSISLKEAENNLKIFRTQNRQVSDSPQLQLELERLLREVEIQTQVFITLQQQFELAKIKEVKEMPSVVVLDKGFPSSEKDKPRRKLIVIFSMGFGLFISLFYILGKRLDFNHN